MITCPRYIIAKLHRSTVTTSFIVVIISMSEINLKRFPMQCNRCQKSLINALFRKLRIISSNGHIRCQRKHEAAMLACARARVHLACVRQFYTGKDN